MNKGTSTKGRLSWWFGNRYGVLSCVVMPIRMTDALGTCVCLMGCIIDMTMHMPFLMIHELIMDTTCGIGDR